MLKRLLLTAAALTVSACSSKDPEGTVELQGSELMLTLERGDSVPIRLPAGTYSATALSPKDFDLDQIEQCAMSAQLVKFGESQGKSVMQAGRAMIAVQRLNDVQAGLYSIQLTAAEPICRPVIILRKL